MEGHPPLLSPDGRRLVVQPGRLDEDTLVFTPGRPLLVDVERGTVRRFTLPGNLARGPSRRHRRACWR